MKQQRLILKRPTGWFAAGCEVAHALQLLSDLSFKLFIYLCLVADRHTGRIPVNCSALAHALRKKELVIRASLIELTSLHVCTIRDGEIEISDRFWPYQRCLEARSEGGQTDYVRQVLAELQTPACVQSAFIPAEEELAIGLYQRGVSLEVVRHAIWLACARKYLAMLNRQTREYITSLKYFIPVVDEVLQIQVPDGYWEHVRHKAVQMERRWLGQ